MSDKPEAEQTEEEMAAAWGASTDAEGETEAGEGEQPAQPARVLNQNEIDSLLGFDDGGGGEDPSGIRAIISSALVSYERLPMLEIVFDRLVRMMTTSLAQFHLRQCRSQHRQHHLDPLRRLSQFDPAAGDAGRLPRRGVGQLRPLTVDSALIYSIVDVLLGGRRGTAAMRIEGRPYTTIERTLVERMVEVVLADLSAASIR